MKKNNDGIAVVGGGSWATALVKILNENKISVQWWMRDKKQADQINLTHHNPKYLSAVEFHEDLIFPSDDLLSVVENSQIIIVAVPAAFVKHTFEKIKPAELIDKIIVSAIKGMIPNDNLIIGEYFNARFNIPLSNIVVISGPCHAEEVALEKLSYLTIACQDAVNAAAVSQLINCRYIRTSESDDIYGTEYSAVLKNIFAIASGICHGLGYGDNFQAVLVSNAIEEIDRFVKAVHPIQRDIKDSAYLGDLLVTAYSQFSRNRTFGNMIGKGYSVTSAQLEMNMIAEGYYASACIHQVNKKYKVSMPIAEAVYNILYQKYAPVTEIRLLEEKLS